MPEEFLGRLLDIASSHERIMVVGRVDTGKSTLVRNMADHMDAYVLDADIGQNDIGPPAVVSLGVRAEGNYRMIDGYFCGSVTPSGHFMPMIAGVSRMLPQQGGRTVLINTTGLATGDIGRTFKTEKINAVKPDLIIGLETGNELKYLDAFAHGGATVIKFKPHPQVTSRSRSERERLRTAMFMKHFEGSISSTHSLSDKGIERSLLGNGIPVDSARLSYLSDARILHAEVTDGEAFVVFADIPLNLDKVASALDTGIIYYCCAADFNGTLIGLNSPGGHFLGLGIIHSIDFSSSSIHIFSPVSNYSILQFGSMKLDTNSFTSPGPFSMKTYRHKH
jgi:polynucleotide 5'-hydroxyl-kinase GRC3/NOL9